MIAAAILTGGHARRFHGRDKSRLPAFPGGPTILDHQLDALALVATEILIVTSLARAGAFSALESRSTRPPVRVVIDRAPDLGPLGAIVTALEATTAPALFVAAGDMPGITATFAAALARLHDASDADVTVVETERGLEPLGAIYGRGAQAALTRALESGALSLRRALDTLRLNRVPAADLAAFGDLAALFRNINRPEDM